MSNSSYGDNIDSFIAAFKEIEPNVTVTNVKESASYQGVIDKVIEGIPANNYPDIVVGYPDAVEQIMELGKIVKLDNYIDNPQYGWTDEDKADIIETYLDEGRSYPRSGVWSLPFSKSTEAMFYNNAGLLTEIATEPTYIWLSRLVLACGGTVSTMFLIYALITIPAKLHTLHQLTPYIFTALTIYIPVYFELHDMVQIRCAAAATFLLASLIPLANKHRWQAALLMVAAILFHYSAAVYLPFLLVGNKHLNRLARLVVAVLLPVCFALYLIKRDLFSLLPDVLVEGKLDFYQKSSEKGEWTDIALLYKNIYFMAKCALLYVCLYHYDYLCERIRMAPLFINLFAASIIFLLTMATIPVVASRVSDLYGLVDCIVFTFAVHLVNPTWVARAGIVLIGLYSLIYNMIFANYFT